MRHFPHHIGDYAAATAHLSFIEDAAYHRLLRRYYQDEKPLPADVATVQRLVGARTRDERGAVATVLGEFFILGEDGWRQPRADRELEAYRARAETARENGNRGGRPTKTKKEPEENRTGFQEEPNEKLTNNQEPVTNNQKNMNSAASASPAAKRGTRLPENFSLTPELYGFASDLGLDPEAALAEFKDFWCGVPGSRGCKLDWDATFRNRCRELASKPKRNGMTKPAMKSFAQQAQEAASTVADRDSADQWRVRMRQFRQHGFWHPAGEWGPEPGLPGCRVPASLLIEETRQ